MIAPALLLHCCGIVPAGSLDAEDFDDDLLLTGRRGHSLLLTSFRKAS
jgi:hypothetical protein